MVAPSIGGGHVPTDPGTGEIWGSDGAGNATPVAYGGGVTLAQAAPGVAHTGDTAETLLATIPVGAGVMGTNGRIGLAFVMTKTGTAGVFTPHVRFGLSGDGLAGTEMWSWVTTTSTNLVFQWAAPFEVVVNLGDSASQSGGYDNQIPGAGQWGAPNTAAIDTTQATELVISCALGNAGDTITLASYRAVLYPHA